MVGDDSASAKERREAVEKAYKTTLDWLKEVALKDKIEKAEISERLVNTPCALVASQYGWSGNMERIMRSQAYTKASDPTSEYYLNQKKIFEINPRHPIVKELNQLVEVQNIVQRVIFWAQSDALEQCFAKSAIDILYYTNTVFA